MVSIAVVREAWRNLKETPWPFFTFLSIVVNGLLIVAVVFMAGVILDLFGRLDLQTRNEIKKDFEFNRALHDANERVINVLMKDRLNDTTRR